MLKQTKTAINTLKDIYGKPSWMGSGNEKFAIDEWDKLLKNYSDEQVKKACLRYAKFKKDGIFPSLACIEAELVDEKYNEVTEDKVEIANRCYVYCMAHKEECNPVPTELTIKQSIWETYGVAVGGFDPERDGTLK